MQSSQEIGAKICQGRRNKACTRGFLSKAATPLFRTFISSSFIFFIMELLVLKINEAQAVPDLEQSLLDSNFIEPAKLQLLFRPSRKYAPSTHFIHIRVPFNFSQLLQTPDQIFLQYQCYTECWPEPFRTQVEEVADFSRSCLADKINDFVDIRDALPQNQVVTRDKCFLDWACP